MYLPQCPYCLSFLQRMNWLYLRLFLMVPLKDICSYPFFHLHHFFLYYNIQPWNIQTSQVTIPFFCSPLLQNGCFLYLQTTYPHYTSMQHSSPERPWDSPFLKHPFRKIHSTLQQHTWHRSCFWNSLVGFKYDSVSWFSLSLALLAALLLFPPLMTSKCWSAPSPI